MYCVSIAYPQAAGASFDFSYYLEQHMPMVTRLLGDNCLKSQVRKGITAPDGSPAAFVCLVVRGRSRLDVLTPRETAVAEAFGRGSSYKEIARQLDLSPATIRFYLRAIYEKLQVRDKGELASLLRQEELHIDGATLAVRYRQLHQARFI